MIAVTLKNDISQEKKSLRKQMDKIGYPKDAVFKPEKKMQNPKKTGSIQ